MLRFTEQVLDFRSRDDRPARPGRTFEVVAVRRPWLRLRERSCPRVIAAYAGGRVEACGRCRGRLVAPRRTWSFGRACLCQPLIETLYRAYTDHRPITLSPDAAWLTLLQGVAMHVRENAEALRPLFTRHGERLTIEVRRGDF